MHAKQWRAPPCLPGHTHLIFIAVTPRPSCAATISATVAPSPWHGTRKSYSPMEPAKDPAA